MSGSTVQRVVSLGLVAVGVLIFVPASLLACKGREGTDGAWPEQLTSKRVAVRWQDTYFIVDADRTEVVKDKSAHTIHLHVQASRMGELGRFECTIDWAQHSVRGTVRVGAELCTVTAAGPGTSTRPEGEFHGFSGRCKTGDLPEREFVVGIKGTQP